MTRLKKLNLSHNKLDEFPKEIGSLVSLTELQAAHNRLHTLPESMRSVSMDSSVFCSSMMPAVVLSGS